MDEYVNVNGYRYKAITKEEKRRRLDKLDRDTILRWAYIPFVIAEGVWDYADTVINIAVQMRLEKTKPLSRAIRNLRQSFERKRCMDAFGGCRKGEMKNFMVIEDGSPKMFDFICDRIRSAITNAYPNLEEDYINLIVATYECYYLLDVLFKYTDLQSKKICEQCNFETIGSIIPDELFKLRELILEFCGDKRVKVNGHGLFTYNIVKKLNMTIFNDKKNE